MSKGFHHIINSEERKASINLLSEIGGNGVSGQRFADHIQFINEMGDIDVIDVFINSPGGSVSEGFSIFHAILNSQIPVNTIIVGQAASMAAPIAFAGKHISIVDYGSIMVHGPRFAEGFKPDEDNQKALDIGTDQLAKMLANRTGSSEKHFLDMFAEGDKWFKADEAKAIGLVDEVLTTKKQIAEDISFTQLVALIQDKPEPAKPATTDKPEPTISHKQKNMTQIAQLLNLSAEASPEAINTAVQELKDGAVSDATKIADLDQDLKAANDTIAEQKEALDTFHKDAEAKEDALVKATLAEGVKTGKIDEKNIEELEAQFKGNSTGLIAVFGSMKTPAPDVIAQLQSGDGDTPVTLSAEQKDWTYRQWEQNDQDGLNALIKNNEKYANKLHVAEYGTELA